MGRFCVAKENFVSVLVPVVARCGKRGVGLRLAALARLRRFVSSCLGIVPVVFSAGGGGSRSGSVVMAVWRFLDPWVCAAAALVVSVGLASPESAPGRWVGSWDHGEGDRATTHRGVAAASGVAARPSVSDAVHKSMAALCASFLVV